jgi:Protein of unknown function (DUF2934)
MSNRTTPSPGTQPSQVGKSSSMTSGTGMGSSGIPHERIAQRAYEKWCQRGFQHGRDQQDWQEAEAELRAEMAGGRGPQASPSMPPSPAARPTQPASMPQKSAQRR